MDSEQKTMSLSRHKLYAFGEPLGESVTMPKPQGGYLCGGGDGGSSSSSNTTTTNQDNRVAVQDGVGVSASSNNTVTYNDPDAVKAIAQMSADAIKSTGGAIVELGKSSNSANVTAWDTTVKASAALVDKLIDKAAGLGQTAIQTYQPTANKAEDSAAAVAASKDKTALQLGVIAAAAVAAVVILKKVKA